MASAGRNRAGDHRRWRAGKVVLARTANLVWDRPLPPEALLAASRRANPHCYQIMLRLEDESALVCASPERLWLRQQNELLTEALAGTVACDSQPEVAQRQGQWLLRDGKNRRENGLVMEDICQRLHGMVSGLEVMPVELVRLRNVQHLRRRIHGELRSRSDALCLQRLQPTAAVAGLPRTAARAFYSGTKGWIATGTPGHWALFHDRKANSASRCAAR